MQLLSLLYIFYTFILICKDNFIIILTVTKNIKLKSFAYVYITSIFNTSALCVIENRSRESDPVSPTNSCNVSSARGASNGAGEAAYLIRNKYSCHIPGAGWCQVFDCYPTPHVRERPRASAWHIYPMFQRSLK